MKDDLEDLSRASVRPRKVLDPTRAEPQPWFVGDGRGLMFVVIGLVAALFVMRLVSTIWLAEAAFGWLATRYAPAAEARLEYPHGPIAIDLRSWVTQADYPVDEYELREGTTVVELGVDAKGRLTDCWIEGTSGSGYLDHAACDAIEKRARFTPARDASGRAIASLVRKRISWKAPPPPLLDLTPYESVRIFSSGTLGKAGACRQFSGGEELREPYCDLPAALVRRAQAAGGTSFALAARTRLQIAEAPPAALSPLAKANRLVEETQLRARIGRDGRISDCMRTMRRGDEPPEPAQRCDLGGRTTVQFDAAGNPVPAYVLIEDRISVRSR